MSYANHDGLCERDLCRANREGFEAGARSMRERAAKAADRRAKELTVARACLNLPDGAPALARSANELLMLGDAIRALPLGEEGGR